MMKKSRPPRKSHPKVLEAQSRLDHAVVRGEPTEVLNRLRQALEETRAQVKKANRE